MAGFVCVGEFFLEEKMSKMGTEELVTISRLFGYKQQKSDFNWLRIL